VNWNREIFKGLEKSVDIPEPHSRNLLENSLALAETYGEYSLK
jgi:hypothetical protein